MGKQEGILGGLGIERAVGVEALEIDRLRLGVGIERNDLALRVEVADVVQLGGDATPSPRRQFQRTESPAEPDVVRIAEAGIADHADGVFRHGALEFGNGLRRRGDRGVEAGDLGSEQRMKRFDLHGTSCAAQGSADSIMSADCVLATCIRSCVKGISSTRQPGRLRSLSATGAKVSFL